MCFGLTNFLQIKHRLKVSVELLNLNTFRNLWYFSNFQKIYGLS